MKKHTTILGLIVTALLLSGCGGPRKLLQGKYEAGAGAIQGSTMQITASQIMLALPTGQKVTFDYKVTGENKNVLTLELTGGTLVEKTTLDVTVEKTGITIEPKSFFSAVLQGTWTRS